MGGKWERSVRLEDAIGPVTAMEADLDQFKRNQSYTVCAVDDNLADLIILNLVIQTHSAEVNGLIKLNGTEYKFTDHCADNSFFPSTDQIHDIVQVGAVRLEVREPCRRIRLNVRGRLNLNNDTFLQWGMIRVRAKVDEGPWNELELRGFRLIMVNNSNIKKIEAQLSDLGERIILIHVPQKRRGSAIQFGYKFTSARNFVEITRPLKSSGFKQHTAFSFSSNYGKSDRILLTKKNNSNEKRWKFEVHVRNCAENLDVDNGIESKDALTRHKKLPMVVPLNDVICEISDLTGGKSSHLAKLMTLRNNFEVPDGVVVTVEAYNRHLAENSKVNEFIQQISTDDCHKIKASEVEIRALDLFMSSTLSDAIKSDVLQQLATIFGADLCSKSFAVRSSAVGEDGAELSSAGQLESYLNLSVDEVCDAIVKCWASNFRTEVVSYRLEYGQPLNVPVAVVVQEMIQDGVAGVLFTQDPVSLNPARSVLNLVRGCGEALVSGHSNPSQIVFDNETGTVVDQSGPQLIPLDISRNLVQIGTRLQAHFKAAQDIEFVVKSNTVYLVQSRNITNLHLESDWELEHEFDTGLSTAGQVLSTANVGEVMGIPGSPLDCSVMFIMYSTAIIEVMNYTNLPKEHRERHTFPYMHIYRQRCFIDIMESYLKNWENVEKDATSQFSLAGTEFITAEMIELAKRRFPRHSGKHKMYSLYKVYKIAKTDCHKFLSEMEEIAGKMKKITTENEHSFSLSHLSELIVHCGNLVKFHSLESMFSSAVYTFVAMLLRGEPEGKLSPKILHAIAAVYGNNPLKVVSADVPIALNDIAQAIKSDTYVQTLFNSDKSADEIVNQLKTFNNAVGTKVRDFFFKHGHRGLHELSLLGEAWSDDCEQFVNTLKSLLQNPNLDTDQPKQVIEDKDELIDSLDMNITGIRRKLLKKLIPSAHEAVFVREAAKNQLVLGTSLVRHGAKLIGERLFKEGKIHDPRLILFLTFYEIRIFMTHDNRRLGIISRARRRMRCYDRQAQQVYPLDQFSVDYSDDVHLIGTAVCEGIVEGLARVAKSLAEARTVRPGEILITQCTDIAWSPLFPILKGLVTEVGGLLSHGAVVAREYGLACVIAVPNATDLFQTGDLVRLDAHTGSVRRLRPA